MRETWKLAVAAMGVTMLLSAGTVMAQDNTQPQQGQAGQPGQPGQPGQRGNRGNRGNFDPAQFRQQMMDRMKQQLGATDEEWTALEPKIQKVMDAQRDTRGGRGGFGGRRGGADANGPQPQQPQSDVAKASAELRAALDNKDTPPAEIQQKLAALRDAREKAKANLTAAQKELKELLTARQEATLVNMGMLE